MNQRDILGPWKLVSMKATNPQGDVFHPFGENPAGMIMYDASGYMSYTAMRTGRPKFESGDAAGGTPEEVNAAFEGFDAYRGTYELNLEGRTVTHHVKASKLPNWEDSEQIRYFRIEEDKLLIDTPPIASRGSEWVIHVVFARP